MFDFQFSCNLAKTFLLLAFISLGIAEVYQSPLEAAKREKTSAMGQFVKAGGIVLYRLRSDDY